MRDSVFTGGLFDFLSPFSVFTGVCLPVAYSLLGATWLVLKTDGSIQGHMRRVARSLMWALLAAIAIVSVWTPYSHPAIAQRWFSFPNIAFLSPVPILSYRSRLSSMTTELVMPPFTAKEAVYGMAMYSVKAVLSGHAGEVMEMIGENLPK